jgi:hypothetical protein
MKILFGAAVAAGIAWAVAPWVAMARRGTLDEQALADMRAPVVPQPRRSDDVAPWIEETDTAGHAHETGAERKPVSSGADGPAERAHPSRRYRRSDRSHR